VYTKVLVTAGPTEAKKKKKILDVGNTLVRLVCCAIDFAPLVPPFTLLTGETNNSNQYLVVMLTKTFWAESLWLESWPASPGVPQLPCCGQLEIYCKSA
jgi:hypothetical protein